MAGAAQRKLGISVVSRGVGLATLCLGAFGCGAPDSFVEATPTTEAQPLWLWSSAQKWPNGNVPVCWQQATTQQSTFAADSAAVRDAALNSWPAVAAVNFTGWLPCVTDDAPGFVTIEIDTTSNLRFSDAGGIGYSPNGLHMVLAEITRGTTAHEFGHVLGFAHEMARPGFVDQAPDPNPALQDEDCNEANVSGNGLNTAVDNGSIMNGNYCRGVDDLSTWDIVGVQTAYGLRTDIARPLVTGYNPVTEDHLSTAWYLSSVTTGNYSPAYADGWLLGYALPGTARLETFYHAGRGDYVTTATPALKQAALAAGYAFVEVEGYVFTSLQPGTRPLKQWWHGGRADHMLTAGVQSQNAAQNAGYTLLYTEGYIPTSTPYTMSWRYWHAGREDHLLTAANSTLAHTAENVSYVITGGSGFDGAFWVKQYPGTVPVKTYYSSARGDHFALATTDSENAAISAGYGYVGNEGYIYPANYSGTAPFNSHYNSSRGDHMTTLVYTSIAPSLGYPLVRTEGWGFPINNP
jgi:hypothetical protein